MNNNNSSNSASGAFSEISAIIPVYNEAGKIGRVLDVLRQVDRLHEIIVVDDGSTDLSAEEIQFAAQSDPRIRLVANPVNQGKGQAIFLGWQATESHCLLLLDGDLFGLNPQHIQDLINPVLDNHADMAIGQFKKGKWASDIAHWFTPWLSGQRSLRADLLRQVSSKAAAGYGFETALTVAARQYEWRCVRVFLPGVWHLPGEARRGFWKGLKNRARMYRQISSAWYQAGGLHRVGLKPRVR
ncbi:MAG: glycosyltransferase family 2 protein [Chloroflexi bacterium]|nr:glycosyltransferase family 2 protein [Chloroflexota bacterium]